MKDKVKHEISEEKFIPTTMERHITRKIVYRPIRSWHSNTYAGEGLERIPGTDDHSGCTDKNNTCTKPYSVTHRLYWNKDNPRIKISAFLSYPRGMGACDEYFWEIYPCKKDIERFTGKNAEREMEATIKQLLEKKTK